MRKLYQGQMTLISIFFDSCFLNNYFKDGLSAWETNIDIQPVFNHYQAITMAMPICQKKKMKFHMLRTMILSDHDVDAQLEV